MSGLTYLCLAGDRSWLGNGPVQDTNHPLELKRLKLHDPQISQAWLEVASQRLAKLTSLELHNCYEPAVDDEPRTMTTYLALAQVGHCSMISMNHHLSR